ncbi:MAG: methylated-DNA--[protein]-cysteine S-methyltransferase [Congregibacter sp.]
MTTHLTLFPTALGECGIAWRDGLVVATNLPERDRRATIDRLSKNNGASEDTPPPTVQDAIAQITQLLSGNKIDLGEIRCDFGTSSDFEVAVYGLTRAIPVGETRTYGEIASQLGNPRYAQNVGRALGRNPLPIIVPCHRVIGANDKLTGFSAHGGLSTKLRMLAIEGAPMAQPGLFDELS